MSLLVPESIANQLPAMVQGELSKLDETKQLQFIEEFKRKRKSTAVAYIGWLFLGWHYAYLGRWGWQVLYWLTSGGLVIWALVDLFRIPSMVRYYNKDAANDVMLNLKAISAN